MRRLILIITRPEGFEPSTFGFGNQRSTTELRAQVFFSNISNNFPYIIQFINKKSNPKIIWNRNI